MNPPPAQRFTRLLRRLLGSLLLGFIALNLLAFLHGRSMSRYSERGARTSPPETLNGFAKAKVLLTGATIPRPENTRSPADYGLDFETVYFSGAFEVRLEAWHVRKGGSRGIILMFHGHGAAKDSLLPAAEAFHELGWDCGLVDFHGSGGSGTGKTSVGWYEANDVAAAFRHFAPMYPEKPVVLYGASMGSTAILRAVHDLQVSPTGVVLELPFDRLLNAARTRFKAMHLPSWPAAELLVFYGGLSAGFNGFALNPASYARSVTCPALVLNGELDPRAPSAQAVAVFKNLAGPKTRRQFAGIGHRTLVQHDPKSWRATLSAFLEQVESAPVHRPSQ